VSKTKPHGEKIDQKVLAGRINRSQMVSGVRNLSGVIIMKLRDKSLFFKVFSIFSPLFSGFFRIFE